MANNPGTNHQERTFRCADAGFKECHWQVRGGNDEEIIDRVREHGREAHGITNFDENMRRRVQDNIHDRQAA